MIFRFSEKVFLWSFFFFFFYFFYFVVGGGSDVFFSLDFLFVVF